MNLRIEQSYEYLGDDYWKWSAWIGGPDSELAAISSVNWHLHPSFSPSMVTTSNKSNRFRLDTSGWGTFLLRAELVGTGGSVVAQLDHMLELYYPEDPATSEKSTGPRKRSSSASRRGAEQPRIFLTYDSEDRKKAQEVRKRIESMGIEVLDPTTSVTDDSIANTAHLVQESDGVIALVCNQYPSPLLTDDVKAGLSLGKPMLILKDAQLQKVLGLPPNIASKSVTWSDTSSLAGTLGEWASKL